LKKDGKVLRSERYCGAESWAFMLGSDIDAANAKARFDNRVREMTLPKRATSNSKRVTLQ